MQHGSVTSKHFAYNWAKTLCENEVIKDHVVDYFLTFGSFWHKRIQIPGKYQEIGAPWFSLQRKRYGSGGSAILFLAAADSHKYVTAIQQIIRHFPHKEVIVREHPAWRHLLQESGIADIPGVTIDTSTDLYETLSSAEIVIGSMSTSIFEALALGKRVFIQESEDAKAYYSPLSVTYFSNEHELIDLIHDEPSGKIPPEQQESLFCTDWKENYTSFINTHIK